MNRSRWILGLTLSLLWTLSSAQQCCLPLEPPESFPFLEGASWPTWGRDLRKSHFQPDAAGPDNPAVIWTYLAGGALNEPVIDDFATLWIPQTRQYLFLDGPSGATLGSFGPFQGVPTTPLLTNAAIVVVDGQGVQIGTGSCLSSLFGMPFPDYVPMIFLAGGQSDFWMFTTDPLTGDGYLFSSEELLAAFDAPNNTHQYRTNTFSPLVTSSSALSVSLFEQLNQLEGLVVDGQFSYGMWSAYLWDPLAGQQFPAVWFSTFVWVVQVQTEVDTDTSICTLTDLTNYDLFLDMGADTTFPGLSYAPFSASPSGFIGMGFHNGIIVGFPPGGFPWVVDIAGLTDNEVSSDAFDRALAVTSDESLAIACAVKTGRVFGVETASGVPRWEFQLNAVVVGGPSIGPDPGIGGGGGAEDTVYLVGTRPGIVYALRASTGELKWQFQMAGRGTSSPTIDRNGVVYVGDSRGNLYALNPDGTLKWSMALNYAIKQAPILDADGMLYVAGGNRYFFGIGEQGDEPGNNGGTGDGS